MKVIGVQRLGTIEDEILDAVRRSITEAFDVEVRELEKKDSPVYALDERRRQFNSELVLRQLLVDRPSGVTQFLAVTDVDLFIPMLTFVFGQAQLRGAAALVSVARMRQEFYRLPPKPLLTIQRVKKEAVHELGHALGLTHCLVKSCPMSLTTSVQLLDQKGTELCGGCRTLLRRLLQ